MKNVQIISDSFLCSNCGACSAICPQKCINFKWTNIGRLILQINNSCIKCKKCINVCPSIDKSNLHNKYDNKYIGPIISVFHGKSTNKKIFQNAQSGGVATGILSYLFMQHLIDAAIVCRMDYGTIPSIKPIIINSIEQLNNTQKSFYTPVPLLSIINNIEKFNSVAIIGIPCQIQGIVSIMESINKYKNIRYKIGLICEHIECATIQNVIKSYTKLNDLKIDWKCKYNSKTNEYDYKYAPIVAYDCNGNIEVIPREYRFWLKDMFTPPRCRICWDKLNIFSDITLGDPWRLENIDWNKGESLVIVRTQIGKNLIKEMMLQKHLQLVQIDNDAPIKSQLINKRKRDVELYSNVFKCISSDINTYLINQCTIKFSNSELKKAKNILYSFKKNETLPINKIIQKAKIVIFVNKYYYSNIEKIKHILFVMYQKIFK